MDLMYIKQGRRMRRALAPQFLAKQLTLSQPGGQIMPTTVLRAPPDFETLRRPCSYKTRQVVPLYNLENTQENSSKFE